MKKFATMSLMGILLFAGFSMAAGYGNVRAPFAPAGCSTCVQSAPQVTYAPSVQETVFVPRAPVQRSEILSQETVTTTVTRDVVEYPPPEQFTIQRSFAPPQMNYAPVRTFAPVKTFHQPVLRAPIMRAPCSYGGCGVGAGVTVRTPRTFVGVNTGFNGGFVGGGGTAVRTRNVSVDAVPGQQIRVRTGGLRGVLFGKRIDVR